jgi:thiamine-phosphate pyrophosphorylase
LNPLGDSRLQNDRKKHGISMTDPAILRLLDANANRAREALRVMEDYARFVLDDGTTSRELKQIRHDLAKRIPVDAILSRDTPGDVGTKYMLSSERVREDMAAVITAAGKRLGEALRTIEEFLKTINPADAAWVESIRYRAYDVEQKLAFTLHPASRFAAVRLCVLITESACKVPVWDVVADQAMSGGADCVQLREKNLEGGEFLKRAQRLVELCRSHGAICIINDRPDIALLSGADGVHLGQDDLPVTEARKILGRDKIIGVSTHCMDHAKAALRDGADYLGVGPFFKSDTKPRDFIAGPSYAAEVARTIHLPLVAIAGINEENVDQVLAAGIRAIAVTAAVTGQDDPKAAAARLKARLVEHRGVLP